MGGERREIELEKDLWVDRARNLGSWHDSVITWFSKNEAASPLTVEGYERSCFEHVLPNLPYLSN